MYQTNFEEKNMKTDSYQIRIRNFEKILSFFQYSRNEIELS